MTGYTDFIGNHYDSYADYISALLRMEDAGVFKVDAEKEEE